MNETTTSGNASGRTTEYLELRAENAALCKWSKAWKRLAKMHRDFANLYLEKAQKWQGLYIKSKRENSTLKERIAELEAELEIMEGRAIVAENEVFRLTRYTPPVTSNESNTQYITYSDNRTYDGEGIA